MEKFQYNQIENHHLSLLIAYKDYQGGHRAKFVWDSGEDYG